MHCQMGCQLQGSWMRAAKTDGVQLMQLLLQGGEIRYCQKCSKPKPPRTHHCKVCKRCVLR